VYGYNADTTDGYNFSLNPIVSFLYHFFSSCFKPFYSKIQNKTPTYVLSQYCFVILYNILICDYIYD
jgi:hypothetical protein